MTVPEELWSCNSTVLFLFQSKSLHHGHNPLKHLSSDLPRLDKMLHHGLRVASQVIRDLEPLLPCHADGVVLKLPELVGLPPSG